MADYLKENNLYEQYASTVNAFRCTAAVVSIDKITQFSTKQERNNRVKERMAEYKRVYDSTAGIDQNSMSIKVKLFIPFLKLGIVFPIVWCSKLKRMLG